jgi:hypothetical protein
MEEITGESRTLYNEELRYLYSFPNTSAIKVRRMKRAEHVASMKQDINNFRNKTRRERDHEENLYVDLKSVKLSLTSIKHRTMKTYGEWRYSSAILDLGTRWRWKTVEKTLLHLPGIEHRPSSSRGHSVLKIPVLVRDVDGRIITKWILRWKGAD